MDENLFPTITLNAEKCKGCVSCMKRCPMEAIRVRDGKAQILYERCIACGECVRACPNHAKREILDSFDTIKKYKYSIAIPCPSIYGQFANLTDINYILQGLLRMGFDAVYEAAIGSEIIVRGTKMILKDPLNNYPIISNTCPAVLMLIRMKHEHLIPNISPFLTSEEITAKIALNEVMKKTGLKRNEIGVFVVSPCSAKAFNFKIHSSENCIDGAIAFSDIYVKLLSEMNSVSEPGKITKAGVIGLRWGYEGGETASLDYSKAIYAGGMENVLKILDDYDLEKLKDVMFFELSCCSAGCVGGTLNIENAYLARARISQLIKLSDNYTSIEEYNPMEFLRDKNFEPLNVFRLSESRLEAIKKIMQIDKVLEYLPGIDCGSCGTPGCRAFAEDYVNGIHGDCKFIDENKLKELEKIL